MRPFRSLVLLTLVTSAPGPVLAETTLPLSLAQALGRAGEASPRLDQLRALEAGAGAALRGARAQRMPQLLLGASYTRVSDVPEFRFTLPGGEIRTLFPNIPDNTRTRADLTLPLYTGGRVQGGIRSAEQQRLASASDVEAGQEDLVWETATAYWSLVTAREAEAVVRQTIASYDAHLEDARNLLEQGMVARNDLLAVQVARDRAELERLEAANRFEAANANLLRLLALPADTRIDPTEPVALPESAPEDVEALVAAAQSRRPEIAALRARVQAAQSGVGVARSAKRPQVSLQGAFEYSNPNQRVLPLEPRWQSNWSLGVALSLNAFDGGRASAAAAEARARADVVKAQLQELERGVRLQVTTRLLDLATARAALEVAGRSLEAARENVRVSGDRYREGVSPSSDLLDAETSLLRAGLDRTLAATQVRVAQAGLDRAAGR